MLVSLTKLSEYASKIASLPRGCVAMDFETTGLNPWTGDKAFLVGLAHRELGNVSCLLTEESWPALKLLCLNPRIKYAAHNAKFEMAFLALKGVEIQGDIWDTEVMARVECNSHSKYGLQACAERIGMTKHAPMLAWLEENGKKYSEAPLELIAPYVEQDAYLSLVLYERQAQTFREWDLNSPVPAREVVKLEMKTTKALFEMERAGVHLDIIYADKAFAHEQTRAKWHELNFERLAGVPFVDSAKTYKPLFDRLGLPYGVTKGGRPSFDAEALERLKGIPIPDAILARRQALKRANTYWKNLIGVHKDGIMHPNIRQTGAETSRMSITDPAAQTWPDDSEDPSQHYPIRRALSAGEGYTVSIDYSQMELRLMCDEAGDVGMIRAIQEGTDFHQELATQAGVSRGLAKNGRFAKLYGAGVERVADTLGVSFEVSKRLCSALENQSPHISQYIRGLIQQVRIAPYGYNWLGRRYHFDKGFEYKYPNYRIQGGCGEILRIAICDVADFLKAESKGDTRIVLPIHDELVFKWDECDLHLIPEVKRLMINAHRSKQTLAMDVSVAIGRNFHDLEDWSENAAGNTVQAQGA